MPASLPHVVRTGVQALDEGAVIGPQAPGELSPSTTDMNDQSALKAGGPEDFSRRTLGPLRLGSPAGWTQYK
jgi:hypothetical protein